ncbi:AAA family ATPase [Saccharomonospora viridis]|uniref:AAA+ family ATPase n=2 Tax=Saccharomonospora viridis TaxID=1852 RepID=C7MPZ3_SACVD|nr:AAA family ATPase [Saccharomonospora viridis]ACU98416.1 AAA+ family ATPase [Saccharomonospora viridis DSM 43017]KHF44210.1 ATPase [Saccharomonospora viridis]SFP59319.1 transitional endoplasmic reticulum ATPase [Saccharomonospora viridis]
MTSPRLSLTVRHTTSALDSRRGVVRLHREVLDALGLRAWDAVRITGARVSAAVAACAPEGSAPGVLLADDVTMANLGVAEGAEVVVEPCEVSAARSVTVDGSRLARMSLSPHTLRMALLGKVFTVGDAVSLLPQDLAPPPGSDVSAARGALSRAIGATWTTELLTITATEPSGPVAVGQSTVVSWRGEAPEPAPVPQEEPRRQPERGVAEPGGSNAVVGSDETREEPPPVSDLVGAESVARRLTEWFDLAFRQPELLAKLGTSPRLGVLLSGPEGVGKATLVRSVAHAADVDVVSLEAPTLAVLEPDAAVARLSDAIFGVSAERPCVLLLTDVDALLPSSQPPPVATVVLDRLRAALARPRFAVVATTAHPESVDPRLRTVDLLDRELRLGMPDARTRTELLRVLLRDTPTEHGIDLGAVAERTPGFVAADLVALRRDAALRAALRHADDDEEPRVRQQDLLEAVESVRPISMSTTDTLATGGITLDDVGDMADVKQALTESVLWPLRYPDSFERLGVAPPRGVLIYGPPGNGKTFLVRALAGTGALNVFSVKGAELMDKWVGESERAVRELFRKAAEAAPSLVFLDEVDALAPRRGQSSDSGVSDRVVAALLTELDGVEPLRDVVVVGATNRPELVDPALLRPGRLERLIYVPPPDAEARGQILRAAARNTPLADDVDLDALAARLDGYSAADCAALIREAALAAMRESLAAAEVTARHLEQAQQTVRPSLDPVQLAEIEAYARSR